MRGSARTQAIMLVLAVFVWTVFACAFLGVATQPARAEWTYVVEAAHHAPTASSTASLLSVADFTGDGQVDLAIAQENRLSIFDLSRNSLTQILDLNFPVAISAITAIPAEQPGRSNLVVGTQGAGGISVYRLADAARLELVAELGYQWSPVVALSAGDLTGDGQVELTALTAAGVLNLYTAAADGTISRQWQGKPIDGMLATHLLTYDVDGEARKELLIGGSQGYVGVFRWSDGSLVNIWHAYSWGGLLGLTAIDAQAGFAAGANSDGSAGVGSSIPSVGGTGAGTPAGVGGRIAVVSLQKLLYIYQWKNGTFELDRRIFDARLNLRDAHLLPAGLSVPAVEAGGPAAATDERPILLSLAEGKLVAFRIDEKALSLQSTIGSLGKLILAKPLTDGRVIVLNETGELMLLRAVPVDYARLAVNDVPINLKEKPVFQAGRLLLSLRDVANPLGLNITWNASLRQVTIATPASSLVLIVDQKQALLRGESVHLDVPPVIINGRIYIPLQALSYLVASLTWDAKTRTVQIRTHGQ